MYVFALTQRIISWLRMFCTAEHRASDSFQSLLVFFDFTIVSGKKSARQKYRPKWQKYAKDHFRSCS